MADKRITDFTEAASAGADYYLVTDSLSDGVKKIKPANITPAFTGDVTKTAGGTVTTIAGNSVTNAKAAQMAAGTIKSNLTGALASASDNTINAVMDAAFGATQGAIAYRGASGWSSLAPGTSGQFMQTSGPSANPIWQTIPGGGNMLSSTYDPTGKLTDAFNYTPNGTGAVSRSIVSKLGDVVSVKDFGAKGDGVTNDTAAIQAAINSLPASGGKVLFPPQTYLISSSILIGNGTSSVVSTKHGIALVGLGMPNSSPNIAGYPTPGVPRLLMSSSVTGAPMIDVLGPVQGWAIKNLFLDGANDQNTGILVNSGQGGSVENVTIDNVYTGISSASYPLGGYSGVGNVDSLQNTWTNVNIRIAGAVGAKGVFLNGDSGGTSNTDFNTFINVSVSAKANNTNFGFYLAVADSNVFINCGVNGMTTGLAFDYSFNGSFPNANRFFGYDFATYQNVGTPGAGALAAPHTFYGLSKANNHNVPGLLNTNSDVTLNGSGDLLLTTGTGGLGYGAGAGGGVTQTTSKGTAVTLNRPTGLVTTTADALAAGAIAVFTFNNSVIANTDLTLVQHVSGGTLGAYTITASTGSTGATSVFIRNNTAGSLSEALIIRFAVVRSANF